MKTIPTKKLYCDPDFATACVLVCSGQLLEALDRENPRKVRFCFLRDENTDETLKRFHQGKMLLEPKKLFAVQNELKNRLFNNN